MKSKKGKATDHTKDDTNDNGSDMKDAGSEAESAVSEEAKASSPPKNKRGKKRGNNTGVEDGGTETKKVRNAGAEGAEAVKYEVESIEDTRQSHGKTQFRIRWKGYGPDTDTWENEEDLSCPNVIKAFLEKNKNESKTKKRAGKAADSSFSKKTKNESEESSDSDEEEGGESKEYEVDKVMEVHFKKNGSREFLIHWKGFSHKDDTWEPEKNLNCADLIEKFMAKVDKAKSSAARELRMNPQHTDRFTLNMSQAGRRLSRRNQGKQRATYHGYV